MTKAEIENYINDIVQYFPEKMTGNEGNGIICQRLGPLVDKEREAIIDLTREWINNRVPEKKRKPEDAGRESNMWLALDIVETYRLSELKKDVGNLLKDISTGKTYLPVYEEDVRRYYDAI